MSITPEQAAARIVGEEIRLLSQLQTMAANPRIFAFMCQIVDTARNGHGTNPSTTPANKPVDANKTVNQKSNPNGLTEAVLRYGKKMSVDITIAKLEEAMLADHYAFVAKEPKVAIADVVRRYVGKHFKITKKGEGNLPNVYKWIEAENVM